LTKLWRTQRLTQLRGFLGLFAVLACGWLIISVANPWTVSLLILALYYSIGGLSFNFLFGSLGMFSLAQPVFIAVGGYTSVYLYNTYGVSPWISLLIAPVLAVLVALPIALVATRIGGGAVITALVTLIVAEAATPILIAITPLGSAVGLFSNSPAHITFSAMQFASGADFARIFLMLNVLIIGFWMWWKRSRFGMFATAIKDAPEAAESAGIATARLRLGVFLISAAIAAPAGVVYAQYFLLTSPDLFLGSLALFQILVVALVGGATRPWGTLAAAILITYVTQEASNLSNSNPGATQLTFAAIFLVMALVAPRGLTGTWDLIKQRRSPVQSGGLLSIRIPASASSRMSDGVVDAGEVQIQSDTVQPKQVPADETRTEVRSLSQTTSSYIAPIVIQDQQEDCK